MTTTKIKIAVILALTLIIELTGMFTACESNPARAQATVTFIENSQTYS